MKNKIILIVLAVFLVILLGLIYFLDRTDKIKPLAEISGPTLALFPSSQIVPAGSTFNANIMLNTEGQSVDGVDIFHLNYDPDTLEAQDADSATAGVQIQKGSIFPIYLGNSVDTVSGEIAISGIISPGDAGYSGSGTFATVNFRAKAAATNTAVYFDFTPGSSTDTNVAEHGTALDILAAVTNGNYTVSGGTPTTPPTPTPTKTPTTPPTVPPTVTPTAEPTSEPTTTPTEISQPEQPIVEPPPGDVRQTSPQASPSGTPMAYTSPDEFYSPSPIATPDTEVAGFSRSAKIALIVIGAGIIATIIGYLIWQWYRKKKGITGSPEDDEII